MESLKSQEYTRLFAEVNLYSKFSMNTGTIGFSLFLGIVGFGIGLKNSGIIACGGFPLILSALIISTLFQSSQRITTYILAFYENDETEIFWENRIQILFRIFRNQLLRRPQLMWISLLTPISSVIIISLSYFYSNPENNMNVILYCILLLVEIVGFIVVVYMVYHLESDNIKLMEAWLDMKKNDKKQYDVKES